MDGLVADFILGKSSIFNPFSSVMGSDLPRRLPRPPIETFFILAS